MSFGLFILISCKKDKAEPFVAEDCGTIISYTDHIKPIINTSCVTNMGPGTGCHDAWIFDYDQVKAMVANGKWEEQIYSYEMPLIPNDFGIDSLRQGELDTMRCWIEQGYPNN